ncbi:hypothetical protein [Tautonia plasticadhaerens]|uniref:Uncharacterized protein n=1 Tax=Tautonia plasticadhaerens TaxID=2527974 RepID=A0A518H1L5_9BACT|nr:hypothetical protein [Tautonia plasticadhaerens]QDV34727.1 hypothetical protein ElP_26210 [Tautonia plasticadhaerens]
MNQPRPSGAAPSPHRERLRAGPLSAVLDGGDLRSIRLGGVEYIRRLHVAVRDRDWGTVPASISGRSVESDGRSFAVSFLAEHREGPIDFSWRGSIRGGPDGTITYRMEGEARSTFLRNRIGLCVLHPIVRCAGLPCRVETTAGAVIDGRFPQRIAPHQPFRDIRAIAHEADTGVWVEVRLEGEAFEMEDQRNWTDASFKTYGTPLDLPFPVEVARGTRVEQSATIRLVEPPADPPSWRSVVAAPGRRLPPIGLGIGDPGRAWSPREAARLRALNPGHLRVDLHPSRPGLGETLARTWGQATALGGVPLEVALFLSDAAEAELVELGRAVATARPGIARWLVFHVSEKATGERWVRLARPHLERMTPGVPIGSGSDAYFAELNRGYPPVPPVDFVCYSINPQVHASDDASVVETLEAQPWTVRGARALPGSPPAVVSPITLRPRFNPNATGGVAPDQPPGVLPDSVDPRQRSLLGAAWTLGSIAALAGRGDDPSPLALTYFEAVGWRGVMEREDGPPLPDRFPSRPGEVFPMYHVLADIGEFAGGECLAVQSGGDRGVAALALADGDRLRVLVANLDAEPRAVRVLGLGASAEVRRLDESNAEEAMRSPEAFRASRGDEVETGGGTLPLVLAPYALARIDTARPRGPGGDR